MATWVEDLIAGPMGFKYAVLFPRARDALFYYSAINPEKVLLPTNICPEVAAAVFPSQLTLVPIDPITGMAPMLTVQLYGYRDRASGFEPLDLDPLMTGWYDKPCANSAIISFGRKKILPLNGGGVFLTQNEDLAKEMRRHEHFPGGPEYIRTVTTHVKSIDFIVQKRFKRMALWDRYLGDSCTRIPMEQTMPWRVMRRIPGGAGRVVTALRDEGIAVGTNYPPLPGVTDPGAIQWAREVINFPVDEEAPEQYVYRASEIVKRMINA